MKMGVKVKPPPHSTSPLVPTLSEKVPCPNNRHLDLEMARALVLSIMVEAVSSEKCAACAAEFNPHISSTYALAH